jgi:hypothetical protein
MFNFEHFKNARWGDLYAFFAAGNPPLALQLMMLNTAFLGFMIYRKLSRKYKVRRSTTLALQFFLIAANLVLMFQKDALNVAQTIKQII